MHVSVSSRVTAATLAFALVSPLVPLAAQDHRSPQSLPAPQADEKIDPLLLADAEQLASNGFVREQDRARTNLRVVIEIVRQRGDVTFETSTAREPLADVQAATINRQALFLMTMEGALTPIERAGVNVLFPLDLQYMVAAEIAALAPLRAVAQLVDVKYVWKDNLNKLLTIEGRNVTGSAAQAAAGYTGAGVGVAVIDSNFDLLHPELGGSTTLPNSIVKGGYNYSTPGAAIHSRVFNDRARRRGGVLMQGARLLPVVRGGAHGGHRGVAVRCGDSGSAGAAVGAVAAVSGAGAVCV